MSIPISAPLDIGTSQINLPIEPILVIAAILLLVLTNIRSLISSSFLRHPLTVLALFYHIWMLGSIFYSTDIVISAKYTLINCLHFWVFYFGTYFLLVEQINLKKILFGYKISILLVIVFSFIKFFNYNFGKEFTTDLARPFFADHTIFGASLSLIFPFLILNQIEFIKSKFILIPLILVFIISIYLTHSEAVWLSIGVGIMAYFFIIKFKIKTIFFISTSMIFILFMSLLLYKVHKLNVEKPVVDAQTTLFMPIIQKLSNDVSTLERINRYSCAIRMWKDRPLFGFGAGTYQFAYLHYQIPIEMTRISVINSRAIDGKPHSSGKGGSAHSEYFQNFVELGIFGGILWILLVIFSLHFCLKNYYLKASDKNLNLAIILALLGYFTHALFNNFLHNEEVSFLIWFMIGIIVYQDSKSNT